MDLGKRIRFARQAVGLSQGQACYGICDRTYLSKIENGALVPPPDILGLLADRLRLQDIAPAAPEKTRDQARRAARRWLQQTRRDAHPLASRFEAGYDHWWALREPDPPREFHALTDRLVDLAPVCAAREHDVVSHWLAEAYRYYRWRPYRSYQARIGLERLGLLADRRRWCQVEADGRALVAHLPVGSDRSMVVLSLVPLVLVRHGQEAALTWCQEAHAEPWWLNTARHTVASDRAPAPARSARPLLGAARAISTGLILAAHQSTWRHEQREAYLELLEVLHHLARISGAPLTARHLRRLHSQVAQHAGIAYGAGLEVGW